MYVAMTCVIIHQQHDYSCVAGTWSSSCVGPGSRLQACNSRTISLSSTDDIIMIQILLYSLLAHRRTC